MTIDDKLDMLRGMLKENVDDHSDDTLLKIYLKAAGKEILAWRYSYASADIPEDVPEEYDMIQVFAVVQGYVQNGAEGETVHIESSVHRNFKYADMVAYIRAHVIPYAGVM